MVPNLDLILAALLYGSFIACVLLVVAFVILITLLLAFSFSTFSIVFLDLYSVYSLLSRYVGSIEANLELGFLLLLCSLMRYAISAAMASKPSVDRLVSQLRVKAQRAMNRVDASLLVHTRRL
ncbi:hypothetical protein QQP08_025948 [Theobroma cacao]|uniref:Uncharacterized protein n=1 Tax=Theobroma cacao TaxID=3641 RepID=A0A061GKQ5_THECC|nr:Uncharacterized protein TCM_037169 [Theobroma cacao]WRX33461.1 hypothetical protein QQP08_025948 [Theobroma cacao]